MTIRLNIHEAKTHLSRHLARLKVGETIVLCRRNVPVAEIRALPRLTTKRRPWGLYKGKITIRNDFNAPLPDKELQDWDGA